MDDATHNHGVILHYTYRDDYDEDVKDNDNYHDDVHDNDEYGKHKHQREQMDVDDNSVDNIPNNKENTNKYTLDPRNNQK